MRETRVQNKSLQEDVKKVAVELAKKQRKEIDALNDTTHEMSTDVSSLRNETAFSLQERAWPDRKPERVRTRRRAASVRWNNTSGGGPAAAQTVALGNDAPYFISTKRHARQLAGAYLRHRGQSRAQSFNFLVIVQKKKASTQPNE